jgi:membrane-associated phospholipid phosphatase
MKQINFPFKRKRIITWLLGASFVISVFIVWLVFISDRNSLDQTVFSDIAPHISTSRTRFMLAVSFLGNHQFLLPANFSLMAFFLLINNRWEAIRVAVVSLGSLTVMSLLKNLFHRNRPDNPMVQGITNFSFPSGHAFMSVAFYGLLIWWAATGIRNKWLQGIVISFLILLIITIGFSRIYLRVHFATDVIVGYCIGFVCLSLSLAVINTLQSKSLAKRN